MRLHFQACRQSLSPGVLTWPLVCAHKSLVSLSLKNVIRGFPDGPVVKNLFHNAGDTDLSLVREDPTCCGAAHAPQLMSLSPGACEPQILKPSHPEPRAPQQKSPNEKP